MSRKVKENLLTFLFASGSNRVIHPKLRCFVSAKTHARQLQCRPSIIVRAIVGSSDSLSYSTGKRKSDTRVFLDAPFCAGDSISLPREEQQHLRALRFRNGDHVVVFNSTGHSASGKYQNGTVQILEVMDPRPPTKNDLSVLVAIPKTPSRGDWIVEKLTEIGVSSILFMRTSRTIATISSPSRLGRWKRIAVAASKQSLHEEIPRFSVLDFNEALVHVNDHPLVFLLCASGEPLLNDSYVDKIQSIEGALLVVGPEGGLDDIEVENLTKAGALPVSLGKNRYRIETAAVMSATIVNQILFKKMYRDSKRGIAT